MYDSKDPIPEHPEKMKDDEILDTCRRCRGTCCSYMAIEIDEPTTLDDFQNIRWYCAHKETWVFKEEDGEWHVVFNTPCDKLNEDYSCSIYGERPQVCRDHKFGECDYFLRGEFELEMHTLEEVDAYLRQRFPAHFRRKRIDDKRRNKKDGTHSAAGGQ